MARHTSTVYRWMQGSIRRDYATATCQEILKFPDTTVCSPIKPAPKAADVNNRNKRVLGTSATTPAEPPDMAVALTRRNR